MKNFQFLNEYTYKFDDPIFNNTGAGYIIKTYTLNMIDNFITQELIYGLPNDYETSSKIDTKRPENPLSIKKINYK